MILTQTQRRELAKRIGRAFLTEEEMTRNAIADDIEKGAPVFSYAEMFGFQQSAGASPCPAALTARPAPGQP